MAEIALGILGAVIEVVKWVGKPIIRQFSYLCCFTCNVAALKDEAKNLDYKTNELQERVDTDKNNGREEIHEIVKDWLAASGDIKLTKERILDEATDVGLGSGCLNYAKRVCLTKEAKKTTKAMTEHTKKCNFESVSRSPPIAASSAVPFGKVIHEFNSRKRFEEDIMTNLKIDKNVDKVGVWGIGGVGKTVMAQKILNRALKDGLFHEVVMVTVSQPVEEMVIQKNIAEQLGLTTLYEGTLKPRADKLRARLRQKKRSLILLDDVWEVLNLEKLGIPCDGEWCTIILTSRNKDVMIGMKVENVCELGVLDEDEAWDFFKKMAGTCVEDAILKPIAYEVMKECKGLLVALETLGKAHEDNKDRDLWKDSLEQLRKHNPIDIPNVIKEVYKPLKLSYDRLESKNAQSLFLLCCLFAEDDDIPLEELTYFVIGLRLFDGIRELEKMRGRIRRSIQTLRNRCLLQDSSKEDHVRMHDVVRDVSIFIASKEGRIKCKKCTWISSHVDRREASSKLKLLFMNNKDKEQEMEINIDNLIGGSTKLNVLFIEKGLLNSLPLHTPQSLNTLVLRGCKSLESIAVVGQLESLEILICQYCSMIEELPEQLKGLKHLKLLEMSGCINLKTIAAGVISSLVGLEELKVVKSFDRWKGRGAEVGNEVTTVAGLSEIESLKKLRCLAIEVRDIALAVQPLRLSSKLVKFSVLFGEYSADFHFFLEETSYQRRTCLEFELGNESDGINLEDVSENIFLTRTEYLYARGDHQDFNLSMASAQSIRGLTLQDFTNQKNISSVVDAFSLLEFLVLYRLCYLEEMWDVPIPSNSFNNLKHLTLQRLEVLKRMGMIVLSTTNDFFLQLETIQIEHCREMEHLLVLVTNEEKQDKEDGITLSFPKLKKLHLDDLPRMGSMICGRGIESIQFPLLAEMKIIRCDNFKRLGDDDDDHYQDADGDDDSLHLFCHPKVSFPNLKKLTLGKTESKNLWCDRVPIAFFAQLVELYVDSCPKIKRLFSSSSKIPRNLVNLQKLHIEDCKEMVKVIEDDEEVSSSDHTTQHIDHCKEIVKVIEDDDESSRDHTTKHIAFFPNLQYLELKQLPKLESFCEWRCALELPSLKILDIYECDEMRSFNAAGSFITTAAITVDYEKLESVNDLNAALHQSVEKAKRRREEREAEEEGEEEGEEEEEEEEEEEAGEKEEGEEEEEFFEEEEKEEEERAKDERVK